MKALSSHDDGSSQKGITNAVRCYFDARTGLLHGYGLTIRQRITERCLAVDDMTDWLGYLALSRLLRSALAWAQRWSNFGGAWLVA